MTGLKSFSVIFLSLLNTANTANRQFDFDSSRRFSIIFSLHGARYKWVKRGFVEFTLKKLGHFVCCFIRVQLRENIEEILWCVINMLVTKVSPSQIGFTQIILVTNAWSDTSLYLLIMSWNCVIQKLRDWIENKATQIVTNNCIH